jgi:hypothetical protein
MRLRNGSTPATSCNSEASCLIAGDSHNAGAGLGRVRVECVPRVTKRSHVRLLTSARARPRALSEDIFEFCVGVVGVIAFIAPTPRGRASPSYS